MRLHRFFLSSVISKEGTNSFSDSALVHQLSHVFRLHEGSVVIFFDGTGTDYTSEIVSLGKDEVAFRVLETSSVKPFSNLKVSLAVSLIKKDNLEWIIQKGTELGVSEFIPVVSERSEKKGFNTARALKIMTEALEQSGRSDTARISEPVSLDEFLTTEKRSTVAFHIFGDLLTRESIPETGEVVLCIGPEGGWSEEELVAFSQKGTQIIRLRSPVLRAETAAIAVATLFLVR